MIDYVATWDDREPYRTKSTVDKGSLGSFEGPLKGLQYGPQGALF